MMNELINELTDLKRRIDIIELKLNVLIKQMNTLLEKKEADEFIKELKSLYE